VRVGLAACLAAALLTCGQPANVEMSRRRACGSFGELCRSRSGTVVVTDVLGRDVEVSRYPLSLPKTLSDDPTDFRISIHVCGPNSVANRCALPIRAAACVNEAGGHIGPELRWAKTSKMVLCDAVFGMSSPIFDCQRQFCDRERYEFGIPLEWLKDH
jgi:hypothetical protein